MLNENDLYEGFQCVDDDILERSEVFVMKKRKPIWIKVCASAACFLVLITFGIWGFHKITQMQDAYEDKNSMAAIANRITERYQYGDRFASENLVLHQWKEEYKPIYETCSNVTFQGIHYRTKTRGTNCMFVASIKDSLLENEIGTCEANGNQGIFPVYKIKGVSTDLMIAVKLDERSYVFYNSGYGTRTLGDFVDSYGLVQNMNLERFALDDKYYVLDSDDFVWELFSEYADSKFASSVPECDGEVIEFSATSEALGIYKMVFSVREDGYVWTNITDFASAFFIGEESANKIISYVKKHSHKTEYEPYTYEIIGQLTEVGEDYIIMDDSTVCKNWEDGKTFKIPTEALHIRRYFECGVIQKGDIFLISFSGSVNMETGEVEIGQFCDIKTDGLFTSNGDISILE